MSRWFVVFIMSGLVASVATWQAEVSALGRLYPAALCNATSSYGEVFSGGINSGNGLGYSGGGGAAGYTFRAFCPMIDERVDDAVGLEHSEVTAVNVHGYDATNDGYTRATTCIQEYAGVGGECSSGSASSSSSGTGVFTLSLYTIPQLSAWQSASNVNDFAYVEVANPVPTINDTNGHRFWGYYVSGS